MTDGRIVVDIGAQIPYIVMYVGNRDFEGFILIVTEPLQSECISPTRLLNVLQWKLDAIL